VRAQSLRPVFPSSTFPNHISMITGQYPEQHGIIANNFKNYHTGEVFTLSNPQAIGDGKWYAARTFFEYAKDWGIRSAAFQFAGADISPDYRRPEYNEPYSPDTPLLDAVNQALKWLRMPPEEAPQFIALYYDKIDGTGHEFGPGSEEIRLEMRRADTTFGQLLRALELEKMRDSINIIVLSDHGMARIDTAKVIDIAPLIEGADCEVRGYGPYMHFFADKSELNELYDNIKSSEKNFRIYRREDIPDHLHYSRNANIAPLVAIADPGWLLVNGMNPLEISIKGAHGYDPAWVEMHGIFIAGGPALKANCRMGIFDMVDVFPILCRIFDISIPAGSLGRPENYEFILDK
ncbi:MAG: alkaline phosphatase family protein, partial [Candidatus Kapaibacterium sp.]